MRLSLFRFLSFLGVGLSLFVTTEALAQEAKTKSVLKQSRLNGTIHSVSKDTSSFSMRRGTDERQVVYDQYTTITYQNKPSSADEIKEGRRVICLGKFNGKNQLVATRIDIREGAREGK